MAENIVYNWLPLAGCTSAEKLQRIRLNSLGSLFYFTKVTLRKSRLTEYLHLPLAMSLERKYLKDLYELPRDHFKSTLCSEALPIWWSLPFMAKEEDEFTKLGYPDEYIRHLRSIHDPLWRTLLVSENITNASKLGKRIRYHFESNALFRGVFSDILPTTDESWTSFSLTVNRKPFGDAAHGEGTFDFIGVGGALQSRHYDAIIQDDIVGRKAIESRGIMDDTIEYHKLLIGAFDTKDALHDNSELIIGNRWGFHDLNSHIRENEEWFVIHSHSALGGCCSLHPADIPIFPEEFTFEKLMRWKKRLGAYHFSCFVAGTPILLENFTEKRIEDLQVGDKLVGYDYLTKGKNCHIVSATVQFVNKRRAQVVKVVMKSGRSFICTPDHKFFASVRQHRERHMYRKLAVGGDLCSVYKPLIAPTADEQRDLDWLGGILDGEGSCGVSGQTLISQSVIHNNIVYNEIAATLARLSIPFEWRGDCSQFFLHGGRSLKVRLLSHAKMAKYKRFVDSMWDRSGYVSDELDVVVLIEPLGEMEVYNIQSSSGNYVAAGFATKNCQFLNNPISPEDADFRVGDLNYFSFEREASTGRLQVNHEPKDGIVRKNLPVGHLSIAMAVDPNHSGNSSSGRCRHAIVVVGKSETDYYLLETWARAESYAAFVEKIYEVAARWKLRKFGLETVAAQKYLKFHLEEKNKVSGVRLQIVDLNGEVEAPDGTLSRKKEWRIRNILSPLFENGQFFVQRKHQDFIQEMQTFPKGKFVDQLDALAYVPQMLKSNVSHAQSMLLLQKNQAKAKLINQPYAYANSMRVH
jgi:predicted phage terminase large subunit-like protein